MSDDKPTKRKSANTEELVIPFVSDDEIATGQEDRIVLFASIAANGQAVPTDWLIETLGIKRASLPSLTSRYGYSIKSLTTKDGSKVTRISVKPEPEAE